MYALRDESGVEGEAAANMAEPECESAMLLVLHHRLGWNRLGSREMTEEFRVPGDPSSRCIFEGISTVLKLALF